MKVYFICDESGAKGRDKVGETKPGEIGIFAGFFVPEHMLGEFDVWSKYIESKYFGKDKPHISSLPKPEQISVEREVFEFIKRRNVICTYEAIHAEGFKKGRKSEIQLYENIEQLFDEMANLDRRLKESYKKYKKPILLHVMLFRGLLDKAICFLIDYCDPNKDDLQIYVDRVDTPILKLFRRVIEETIDIGSGILHVSSPSSDNRPTHEKPNKTNEPDTIGALRTLKGKINIEEGPQHFTMIADIISHSLYQHFMKRNGDKIGASLHDPAAVEGHELKGVFYGLSDLLGGMNWWTDAQYMHPQREK